MRIGLFGGTFNPIHMGHLLTAGEVKKSFSLDKFFFILSALPPHKKQGKVVDVKDRMEMLLHALNNHSGFSVSDVELKRKGPSYTIDTVVRFKSNYPEGTEFYLIMGLDAFLEIDTWKLYREFFDLIPIIVMARPDAEKQSRKTRLKRVEKFIKEKISDGYNYFQSDSHNFFLHDKKQPVFIFDVTPMDISSTKIRSLIKKGESIKSLVPEKVEKIIKTRGLYL